MPTSSTRLRSRSSALVATAALAATSVAVAAPAQADIAPPSDLRSTQVASKAAALTWTKTGQDAYRVRFATNAAMTSSADTWDVRGNYFELTRTDANPSVAAPRLQPGKTYYFQVRAVTDEPSGRDNLSGYSKPVAVTLASTGSSELKPVDVKATAGGADSMYVSWRSRGPGVSYVLRYTTNPSLSVLKWKSTKVDVHGATLQGLAAGTSYHFRSRAIDASGKGISAYSSPGVSAKTATSTPTPGLSVLSYNIRKAYAGTSWATRRGPVAASIKARQPDVVGLQEATPGRDGTAGGAKQYDDIVNLLDNKKFSLVTREGSSGTKIVYNTERLSVVDTDAVGLTTLGSAKRYAVWALLKDKRSNKTFFVINTHLEPGSNASSTYNNARIKQAQEVLALIDAHSAGRPVTILGDMNSSRAATPNNGQYATFTSAGYVDPLDNATGTWASGANTIIEHPLDVEYSSYNGDTRTARRTSYPVGTNADYIYVSPGVRVATWRTVVAVDTNGAFVGTIPSDHNMLATTIHLP